MATKRRPASFPIRTGRADRSDERRRQRRAKLTVPVSDRAAERRRSGWIPSRSDSAGLLLRHAGADAQRAGVVVRARRRPGERGRYGRSARLVPKAPGGVAPLAQLRRRGRCDAGRVRLFGIDEAREDNDVRDAVLGNWPVRKLYSKEQRALYAAHAPEGLELDDLSILGPISVLKLKFALEGYDRKLVAGAWLYPDNSMILECRRNARRRRRSRSPPNERSRRRRASTSPASRKPRRRRRSSTSRAGGQTATSATDLRPPRQADSPGLPLYAPRGLGRPRDKAAAALGITQQRSATDDAPDGHRRPDPIQVGGQECAAEQELGEPESDLAGREATPRPRRRRPRSLSANPPLAACLRLRSSRCRGRSMIQSGPASTTS